MSREREGSRRRRARFARIVAEALDEIPEPFRRNMKNIEIVVEDEPDARQRAENDRPEDLLGLYEGVPLTDRGLDAPLLPDKITIFRRSVEAMTSSPSEQRAIIRRTVIHEIAHHFGISDARLHELGLGDE